MALGYPSSILVAYPGKGKEAAFPVPADKQVFIYNVRAFNNDEAVQNVGICRKHVPSQVGLYAFDDSAGTYTAIEPGSAELFSGATDDGFVVQGKRRFNLVGLHVINGEADGVYVIEYWDGSAFVTLATLEVPVFTAAANDTDQLLVFRTPIDWVPGGPDGLDADMYSIRVTSSTAPADAVTSDELWVGEFLEFYKDVPVNAAVQLSFPDTKPFVLNGGEGLFPYFETADAENQFGCYYSMGS